MSAHDLFEDTPRGVILDKQNNKEWLPKDSYGDLGKWSNYQEALFYKNMICNVYAGGHSDWRFPTREEAFSLYNEEFAQVDWEDEQIHIHPLFVKKCARYTWTSEENEQGQALVVNLQDGTCEFMDKDTREHMAVRLVRDAN